MPKYEYRCTDCGAVQEHVVPYDARNHPKPCGECGGFAQYQFPVQAALGFQPFEEHYSESLGLDITGRRYKREILKAMGVQEAGDKVGGARDFDKHAPEHIKNLPPRGVSLSDIQKAKEKYAKRKAAARFYREQEGKTQRVTPQTKNIKKMAHVTIS